jgi:hypothetical protein
VIVALEDYIIRKIRSTQNRYRLLQSASVSSIPPPGRTVVGALVTAEEPTVLQLQWNRSDTDLLELVTALYESNAIRSLSGKFTKKELQSVFERLFSHSIKGAGSKLTRVRDRKNETSVFMEDLKQAFTRYVTRKDNDLDKRRK